ncbi:MAG: PAS domain S-box protein, partial [Verrucomicrobiaceae bacterium]
ACRIAVEKGGLLMAWVGLGEPDTEFDPVAVWGENNGYLEAIRVTSSATHSSGRGPAGQAFRTTEPAWNNDIEADAGSFASKAEALQRGYRSCAAFPLKVSGKVVGVYVVYSDQPGYFDTEELELLNALAENLSFAVESREREQQRLRAEADLSAALHLQKLILESVGEGIYGLDSDGCIVFGNPAATAMLGYRDAEIVGAHFHALNHRHLDCRASLAGECPICQTLRDEQVRRVEHEVFVRKEGGSISVEYICSPLRSEMGVVTGAVVSFRDITERRNAEERLRRTQERYQHLFEQDLTADFVCDPEGQLLLCNPSFARTFGYTSPEEVLADPPQLFQNDAE